MSSRTERRSRRKLPRARSAKQILCAASRERETIRRWKAPRAHGQHRRTTGRRPVRSGGSRRGSRTSRAPSDPDPEPPHDLIEAVTPR